MPLSRRVGVFYGRLAFEALHVDHVGHIEGSGYAFLEIGNKGCRIVSCYGSGVIGVVADRLLSSSQIRIREQESR